MVISAAWAGAWTVPGAMREWALGAAPLEGTLLTMSVGHGSLSSVFVLLLSSGRKVAAFKPNEPQHHCLLPMRTKLEMRHASSKL